MAVFAISLDDSATSNQAIQRFMAAHHYTIPVLRGQDYATAVGVTEIPTTLFIDTHGNVAFKEVDYWHRLVQEFGWRLEAMERDREQVTGDRAQQTKTGNR